MRIYLKILIVCCFIYSCSSRIEFDKELIERLSVEDFSLPSQYNMLHLYVKCNNNQIAEVDVQQLRILYNKSEKTITFKEFLIKILNQQQNLNQSDLGCFVLDGTVNNDYRVMDFKDFKAKYFEKNENSYRLKKGVTEIERKTIFYYCFLNNYVATFNDHIGYYYLIESSELE